MFKNYKINCLVFALKMWVARKLKSYVFITRSIGLNGMIPHFGHCTEKNGLLFVEDYIPKVRKDSIKYTTIDGDISSAGIMTLQAYVEMPTWKGYGGKVNVTVNSPL